MRSASDVRRSSDGGLEQEGSVRFGVTPGAAVGTPRGATFRVFGALLALAGCTSESPGIAASRTELEPAPAWLVRTEARGTWIVPNPGGDEHVGTVHAWVDARVANVRFDKRIFVEVYAPYGDAAIRTLHVTEHRGALERFERWGTDTVEIYPEHGPGGRSLSGPVLYRFRVQHDLGAGDVMVVTPWEVLFGEGEPTPPANDPWDEALVSTTRAGSDSAASDSAASDSAASDSAASDSAASDSAASDSDGSDSEGPEIVFAPFEDPGAAILARIHTLTDRARAGETPTLHLAVMNVNDREIEDALIAAHRAGVQVRVVHDARKHRPWYGWYRGDDRLLLAGVPLLGVRRPGRGAMHDKIVLYDGAELSTGSMNLEANARFENHENLLFTREPELVAAYAARFEAIAGGVLRPRTAHDRNAHDPNARVSVSFAPDEAPHAVVGRLLDAARERIVVAMFTAKDVAYEEDGRTTSLHTKLKEAVARGVEVTALLDHGIHEASEYFGVRSEDDPHDEELAAAGVNVVLVDVPYGDYASMHHKLVVIDDAIAITGAFNWYHDAAFHNDEDMLVWRDASVARTYLGEAVDMLRRYDPHFDASAWPSVNVTFEIDHPGTRWGEQVAVVGELAALGAWQPSAGLRLEGYPIWRGETRLPIGVRTSAKAIVLGDGTAWEPGANRALRVPIADDTIRWSFGR